MKNSIFLKMNGAFDVFMMGRLTQFCVGYMLFRIYSPCFRNEFYIMSIRSGR
ncbi:hypothetical protein SAMN05216357_10136 [Porphyromonadaceae bacterium KH3CP3RA]|nr:hypothetical protein SAMN05216357_10136 [Porphyromonadaceae bacterium KH3CP3RA]